LVTYIAVVGHCTLFLRLWGFGLHPPRRQPKDGKISGAELLTTVIILPLW